MIAKLLIAARGEIAVRIARTCERLGIASVAIHSQTEAEAAHVSLCGEAVCVGGAALRESYLNVPAILAAAKQTGADAIHPGAGPLSRSASFARAVVEAGLTFVGPKPEQLALFADAGKTREVARLAGVRALPFVPVEQGAHGSLLELAREVGYPLIVAATAHDSIFERVADEHELAQAVGACRDRAFAASGEGLIHLEPDVERPRLLSVLLIADARGDGVALGEIERCPERSDGVRALIEEAPAPALIGLPQGFRKRQMLWDAGARLMKEGELSGVAAADFVLDAEGRTFFVRMRPGLPLEHGLVEVGTGIDIVEAQLRIAAGERLPNDVRRAQPAGHALQARLSAAPRPDDADDAPAILTALRWPTLAPGALRVDTDLVVGGRAALEYDVSIARVISHGPTRHQALLTLDRALAESTIEPLSTNIDQLRRVLGDESFRSGQYDAGFVERLASEQQG